MIPISSPSMVLNDSRMPSAFQMDVTEKVETSTTIREMVRRIDFWSQNVQGAKFSNLILRAHGSPGHFSLGRGLDRETMAPFRNLRGKVEKIWFAGCLVARIAGANTASHGDHAALEAWGVNQGDGHRFVSAFARLTRCYVVAPTEMQQNSRPTGGVFPLNQVPSYEGLVLCYDPEGNISWQQRYPSLSNYNLALRTARNPNGE